MPTYQATRFNPRRNQKGITLLEILVVIVLIATFVTFAIPRFQTNLNLHLKKQARVLAAMMQFLYNQAALKNKTYRIHYSFEEDEEGRQSYWVESSTEKITLSTEVRDRDFLRDKLKRKTSQFEVDKRALKKPVRLEKNIHFKDIKTESRSLPISSGHAYTHFFPHGYVEKTQIRLESKKGKIYTIIVNSLTGSAKIYARDIEE